MTYYLQISSTNWIEQRVTLEDAMSTLEKLCDVDGGYLLNEPMSKFGWTFVDMLLKPNFHMAIEQEFTEKIQKSKGDKPAEKFVKFLTGFLENEGCKIKLKLLENN
tara:strand:- start:5495 stop:5812 length:318 start_codon:yes stop_codon:yes gene_type:complete